MTGHIIRSTELVKELLNFQLLVFEEEEVSFVQIRGSIPLFWDQPGLQVGEI